MYFGIDLGHQNRPITDKNSINKQQQRNRETKPTDRTVKGHWRFVRSSLYLPITRGFRAAKFLFVHERGGRDDFQSALVTTTVCWLAGNRIRYIPAAILSLRRKLGCAVWKLLEGALDKLSLLTASHHYRFMMTSSHHYCSHDDFQSSQLFTLKQQLCWLPVIAIVPVMTSSHHNSVHVEARYMTASHRYRFHDDCPSSQQTQPGEFHVRSQSACSGWR